MRSSIIKPFVTALSAIVLLFALNSCETWRQDCAGQIIVENEIPDITLYVGGEPFRRDLFAPPVIFRQTEGQYLTFIALSSNGVVASANGKRNSDGRITILEVIPITKGNTDVTVRIEDNCTTKEIKFSVTVQDTVQN